MAITFYYGSGSNFAWKVWLTLEHKKLPYDLRVVSFQAGDTKSAEFRALNPRGKVPVLVDDDFVLYESTAIVEYLEEVHPTPSVLPGDARARARARRIALEGETCLQPAVGGLMRQTLFKRDAEHDGAAIGEATRSLVDEVDRFEAYAQQDYLAGDQITLADFTVYPLMALVRRIGERQPQNAVAIPPRLSAWMERIEALPYFARTIPPHWKQT